MHSFTHTGRLCLTCYALRSERALWPSVVSLLCRGGLARGRARHQVQRAVAARHLACHIGSRAVAVPHSGHAAHP
eukprot:2500886-Alexandrium_andersonii.AAC.1